MPDRLAMTTTISNKRLPELCLHDKLFIILIASSYYRLVSIVFESVFAQLVLEIIHARHRKSHLTTRLRVLLRNLDYPTCTAAI